MSSDTLEKYMQDEIGKAVTKVVLERMRPFFHILESKLESGMDATVDNFIEVFLETGGTLPEDKVKKPKKQVVKEEVEDDEYKRCSYVISRGSRKNEKCNTRILTEGETYCSKHRGSKDNKGQVKKGGKRGRKPKNAPVDPNEDDEPTEEEEVTIEIKKNERGRYMDTITKFLFHDETTIYGKEDEDGNIVELDEDDLILVKQFLDWKYDYSISEQYN